MGTLYLVATPIGNLEDITLRALRVLREVPLIAAEDTRHTRKLLNHYEIATPTTSYHEHSGPARTAALLGALAEGDIALVTDAGTPALSDPGEELVRAALAAGFPVVPIPGPAAAITALVASGLSAAQFTFIGFLPRKGGERRALLETLRTEPRTLLFYEAPHRLLVTLDDLITMLGDREAALARELTKAHEEFLRGSLASLRARYTPEHTPEHTPRGEYTLVVAGETAALAKGQGSAADERTSEERARDLIREALADGIGTREAAARVTTEVGMPRREAYRLALAVAAEGAEAGER